jgi:dGTPase
VVNGLFPLFMADTSLLPAEWRHDIEAVQSQTELARIVADYVAGMTDRFALQEGARLLG